MGMPSREAKGGCADDGGNRRQVIAYFPVEARRWLYGRVESALPATRSAGISGHRPFEQGNRTSLSSSVAGAIRVAFDPYLPETPCLDFSPVHPGREQIPATDLTSQDQNYRLSSYRHPSTAGMRCIIHMQKPSEIIVNR